MSANDLIYLKRILGETIKIIEQNEYDYIKLKDNKYFLLRVKEIEKLYFSIKIDKLFLELEFIKFNSVSRSKGVRFFNFHYFLIKYSIITIIVLLLLIYIISSYISTPGLEYSRGQYHLFLFIGKYLISGFLLIGLFFLLSYYVQKKKTKERQINIYDYCSFLRKVEKQLCKISIKDLNKY